MPIMKTEAVFGRFLQHKSRAVFLSFVGTLLVSCAEPETRKHEEPAQGMRQARGEIAESRVPIGTRSIDDLVASYEASALARDQYIECVRRYIPNAQEQIETYGFIDMNPVYGGAVSPAREACANEALLWEDAQRQSEGGISARPTQW
jgi:hypothetical protein